ncbi:fimbrial protein [Comamonas testosteroni]|uniref:fimbrial protein n=1 Tax=Comamonas testosteroni TaxID=285 RepID=UPI0005B41C93|nr:type 1 fimbrial protein [Comamonas testosteroni]
MKKAILSIAVLSALGFSAVSHAATVGATGLISFQGNINADTCVVHSNGSGSSGNLTYQMGSVSANSLGLPDTPWESLNNNITTLPTNVNLTMECMSGTNVSLKLTPTVTQGKGIGVSGGAQGVQIMLVDGTVPMDFSVGPVTKGNIALNSAGSADLSLTAYYTKQSAGAVVTTGAANGSVAYELSYD